MHPSRIAGEALAAGAIPELAGYDLIRREVLYGEGSRVDFLLEAKGAPPCFLGIKNHPSFLQSARRGWVEVKSVTLSRESGLAEFPDCCTTRGAKHLAELKAIVLADNRAVVLFIVQRSDCDRFKVAADLDPAFDIALEKAQANGVEVLVYCCDVSPMGSRWQESYSFRSRQCAPKDPPLPVRLTLGLSPCARHPVSFVQSFL